MGSGASSASQDNRASDLVARNRQLQEQVDVLQHRVRELEAKLLVFVTSAAAALQTPDDSVAATSSAALSAFSDCAKAGLNRKDSAFMRAIFDRCVDAGRGLSASALMMALKAIGAPNAPAHDAAAADLLHSLDTCSAGHVNFEGFKQACGAAAQLRALDTFNNFADTGNAVCLSEIALVRALREAYAPCIPVDHAASSELFQSLDVIGKGYVDFDEFMRAASAPDDLEMSLDERGLSVLAPALRLVACTSSDQLQSVAVAPTDLICAAARASLPSLEKLLCDWQAQLQIAFKAQQELQVSLASNKFQIMKMASGNIADFHKGLTERIATGSPSLDFMKAMKAEHCSLAGHSYEFTTGNYKITTTPRKEWQYVVGGDDGLRLACPDMKHHRQIKAIDDLLQLPAAEKAGLTREEVIAIVLYTGPIFYVYNAILRQFPKAVHDVYQNGGNKFSTTLFVLVSAVQKLSRCIKIPPGMCLYRGMGGTMDLPDSFSNVDANGCCGYAEWAFMSTTAAKRIAVQYSGVAQGKPKAMIMEIVTNSIDRGADISEFSQYAGEKEFLFVPVSFVQGDGRKRVEIGPDGKGILTVFRVKINVNLRTETIEQLREKKKTMHLSSFRVLRDETERQLKDIAATHSRADGVVVVADAALRQLNDVMAQHERLDIEHYVNDLKYSDLVTRMLEYLAWSKEKLHLRIESASESAAVSVARSLQDSHRLWLELLKSKFSAAIQGSADKRNIAVRILQSRGLMSGSNASEMVDGVPIVIKAARESWSASDVDWLVAAGGGVIYEGWAPIMACAANGHIEHLQKLLDAGDDVNQCDKLGTFPLFVASWHGHLQCVKILLEKSADVTKCNSLRLSSLDIALKMGHVAVVELLEQQTRVSAATRSNRQKLVTNLLAEVGAKLFEMLEQSDIEGVKVLARRGADLNAVNRHERTAAMLAAEIGKATFIEALVLGGADVNFVDANGWAALHFAADSGQESCINALVKSGADVSIRDKYGRTALGLAREKNHASCVLALEAAGAKMSVTETAETDDAVLRRMRSLSIFEAIEADDAAVIEAHASRGTDLNVCNRYERAAVCAAASAGKSKSLEALAKGLADLNVLCQHEGAAVHLAAQAGHAACVEVLGKYFANVNIVNEFNGRCAVHDAALNGHSSCIIALGNAGAKLDVLDNYLGAAAIHMAAEAYPQGHASAIEALLKGKADPNIADQQGRTALFIAAQAGHASCVEVLAKGGANLNASTGWQGSALHAAAEGGHSECIEVLVMMGANLNVTKDSDGGTALHSAAFSGHAPSIAALLKGKADPNILDANGMAAIHVAADELSDESAACIVLALAKGGANMNILRLRDDDPRTQKAALHFAVQHGNLNCLKTLLDCGADARIVDGETQLAALGLARLYWKNQEGDERLRIAACIAALEAAGAR